MLLGNCNDIMTPLKINNCNSDTNPLGDVNKVKKLKTISDNEKKIIIQGFNEKFT